MIGTDVYVLSCWRETDEGTEPDPQTSDRVFLSVEAAQTAEVLYGRLGAWQEAIPGLVWTTPWSAHCQFGRVCYMITKVVIEA